MISQLQMVIFLDGTYLYDLMAPNLETCPYLQCMFVYLDSRYSCQQDLEPLRRLGPC